MKNETIHGPDKAKENNYGDADCCGLCKHVEMEYTGRFPYYLCKLYIPDNIYTNIIAVCDKFERRKLGEWIHE